MTISELGTRVKTLRVAIGWTQTELAQRSGVSQSIVSRLEAGIGKRPTAYNLQALAATFRMSLQDFLDEDPAALLKAIQAGHVASRRLQAEELLRQVAELYAPESDTHYEPLPGNVIMVPMVSSLAAAGEGAVAEVEYWPYIPTPEQVGHDLVGAIVKGNCLDPRVRDGERIVIDRSATPKLTDVLAIQVDGESLLRILADGELIALNGHPPIPLSARIHVEGVVVFHGGKP